MKALFSAILIVPLLGGVARAQLTAPVAGPSVRQLRDAFVEAVDDSKKQQYLNQIAKTPPQSVGDVEALYDLFMRFPMSAVRNATLDSLAMLQPNAQAAEPQILNYIQQDDPASVLFGIKAAVRIRSLAALPLIKKIAERKFNASNASEGRRLDDRNAWWAQYEALAALAQWEGKDALPLLEKKAKEAPMVAKIMAMYLWPESLDRVASWARGGAADRERAAAALDAPIPLSALRQTRSRMLALVRDPKQPMELRHQLALRAGTCSTPTEVAALLKEQAAAKDKDTRRLLAAALFASRDSQVAPLLLKYAKEDPQPGVRAGARVELREMLPADQYRDLLEWTVKNDPEPENRDLAQKELAGQTKK